MSDSSEIKQLKRDLAESIKENERLKRDLRACKLKLGMTASHCDVLSRMLQQKMKSED